MLYESQDYEQHIRCRSVGCHHNRRIQEHRPFEFFFLNGIGESAYGFHDTEENDEQSDTIVVERSTIIGDAADFIKNYPQYTLEDYLYNLSIAQIQFLLVDNTHVKYLKGKDKRMWQSYNKALKCQNQFENFFSKLESMSDENGEIKLQPNIANKDE